MKAYKTTYYTLIYKQIIVIYYPDMLPEKIMTIFWYLT